MRARLKFRRAEGAARNSPHNSHTSLTGHTLPRYATWIGDQPNNWGGPETPEDGEDCMAVFACGLWFDRACHECRPYACEGETKPRSSTVITDSCKHTPPPVDPDACYPYSCSMDAWDADGDGRITAGEAAAVTGSSRAEVAAYLARWDVDHNGDGAVDAQEWAAMLRKKGAGADAGRKYDGPREVHFARNDAFDASASGCAAGWTPAPDGLPPKCYKKLDPPKAREWGTCEQRCANLDPPAALVCVASAEENGFLAEAFPADERCCGDAGDDDPKNDRWDCCHFIGLYQSPGADAAGAGAGWDRWRSGCASSYRDWSEGEPDDLLDPSGSRSSASCVVYGVRGSPHWFDFPCVTGVCICEALGAQPPPPQRSQMWLRRGGRGGAGGGAIAAIVVLALVSTVLGFALSYTVRRRRRLDQLGAQVQSPALPGAHVVVATPVADGMAPLRSPVLPVAAAYTPPAPTTSTDAANEYTVPRQQLNASLLQPDA